MIVKVAQLKEAGVWEGVKEFGGGAGEVIKSFHPKNIAETMKEDMGNVGEMASNAKENVKSIGEGPGLVEEFKSDEGALPPDDPLSAQSRMEAYRNRDRSIPDMDELKEIGSDLKSGFQEAGQEIREKFSSLRALDGIEKLSGDEDDYSLLSELGKWNREGPAKPLVDHVQEKRDYGTSFDKLKSQVDNKVRSKPLEELADNEEELEQLEEMPDRLRNAQYMAVADPLAASLTDEEKNTVIHPGEDPDDQDLAALAHEIGHASGSDAVPSMSHITPLLNIGALAATHATGNEEYAPAAVMAADAPLLIEEGRANMRANKILQDAGVEGENLSDARKALMKSYGSYLGNTAMKGGMTYGIQRLNEIREDRLDSKNNRRI